MKVKCKVLGMSFTGEKHSIVLEDLTPKKIRLPIIISTEAAIEISKMKSKNPEKSFFNRLLSMTDLKVVEIYIKGVSDGLFDIVTKFNNGKEMKTDSSETFILFGLSPEAEIFVHKDVMKATGVKIDDENNIDYTDIDYDDEDVINDNINDENKNTKEDLESKLEEALENEDYEEAAKLRDQLNNDDVE